MESNKYTPTEFLAVTNQVLESAWPSVYIEGEVASFKVNQGKWVFFDLKDAEASVSCFMPVWDLRMPIEDGMKVLVKAQPKVTAWGRFSLTVHAVQPVGEGSLKKSLEKLKKKLAAEGLFDLSRKREIPRELTHIGVISSTQAAGYADFIKILNARWGGMKVTVAHTQVQGIDAPDQIIRALKYLNEQSECEAIAIIRGGGSADDLSCFNDEELVRAIAASRIPIVTGIGHEVNESLADLAADLWASTPSNAAELISHDRRAETQRVRQAVKSAEKAVVDKIDFAREQNRGKCQRVVSGLLNKYINPMLAENERKVESLLQKISDEVRKLHDKVQHQLKILEVLNPEKVLRQGYAILAGKISPGNVVKITTFTEEIEAEITKVNKRS